MPLSIEEITNEVLALPKEARALLANRLVESLDLTEDQSLPLWVAEGQRRLQELRSGIVEGIPGEQVISSLRYKYRK